MNIRDSVASVDSKDLWDITGKVDHPECFTNLGEAVLSVLLRSPLHAFSPKASFSNSTRLRSRILS